MGTDNTVEYITGSEGMQKIIELGVMSSPVLVVDGNIAMTGFIPDIQEIKDKILAASK
jgi:glutaredoxin